MFHGKIKTAIDAKRERGDLGSIRGFGDMILIFTEISGENWVSRKGGKHLGLVSVAGGGFEGVVDYIMIQGIVE
jgi:hypothetical protein